MPPFTVRRATPEDADAIAAVHGDAVRTLGAGHYSPEVAAEWGAPRPGSRVRAAMDRGGVFFVATGPIEGDEDAVLGFSSYAVEGETHRIAVYVRGTAAHHGVGRAVYDAGEAVARAARAPAISIEAALGAVPFWIAMGFETGEQFDHTLASGRLMPCVRMRKHLQPPAPPPTGHRSQGIR